MPVASANRSSAGSGLGVDDAAAGDDERLARRSEHLGGPGQRGRLGQWARHVPGPFGKQVCWPVVGLGLHVLRERQRHRAGFCRIGEHPHRGQQRRRQLLRAVDPVPEPRHRLERIVDAHVVGARVLELLQQRAGGPGGEEVAGQQQDRDAVDGGERGSGHHVGRAGADRGGAGEGLQAVPHPGEADRRVHHRLLVAGQVVGQVGLAGFVRLEQGLADPRHVAVPEDAEAARDEPLPHAVALAVLAGQEADQGLGDGEADGAHCFISPVQ